MPLSYKSLCHPGLQFSIFVFWLLSLPMGGPLLTLFTAETNPALFLIPHILVLFLAWKIPINLQQQVDFLATILCAIGTLLVLTPINNTWLLPILGITSAIICLRLCNHLSNAKHPIATAALALVTANILLYLAISLPLPTTTHTIIIALALSATVFSSPVQSKKKNKTYLKPYLICLIIFQITFGLMFGHIFPYYNQIALAPGIELIFYLGSLPLAVYLLKYGYDNLLIISIGIGMLAFALLIKPENIYVILSMFSLQVAAGFSDLFVLAWIISIGGKTKEFGYALGCICTGILVGQYLSESTSSILPGSVIVGNIALSIALISFYLFKKREMDYLAKLKMEPANGELPQQNATDEILLPNNIAKLLSNREVIVLQKVLRGETYQNIAQQINISESSVKTYMGRIRTKTGTSNKQELVQHIIQQSN